MGYLKELFVVGLDHALLNSHPVILNIFEIVSYNNNHALKLWCVLNRIIKTSREVHFFPGDRPESFWWDLTQHLWLKIWSDLLFCISFINFFIWFIRLSVKFFNNVFWYIQNAHELHIKICFINIAYCIFYICSGVCQVSLSSRCRLIFYNIVGQ